METTIDGMKRRHEQEIVELQSNCNHPGADWMPYMWAPGHYGPDVKVCKICGKIIDREIVGVFPEVMKVQ